MTTVHGDGLRATIVQHVRDIISVVDADGVVRYVNHAPSHVLGVHDDARGTQALTFVHPDDLPLALERREYLLGAPGRTTTTVLRVRHGDGGWRHLETHGVNLLDDPDVQGLLYVSRDVEDRAQAEAALLRALGAQRVVAELGVRALVVEDLATVLEEALGRVRAVLGTPWVSLGRTHPDGVVRTLLQHGPDAVAPGTPWPDGRPPVQAGLTAVEAELPGPRGALGLLVAHGCPGHPGPTDVQFLQGVANVLAAALLRDDR